MFREEGGVLCHYGHKIYMERKKQLDNLQNILLNKKRWLEIYTENSDVCLTLTDPPPPSSLILDL